MLRANSGPTFLRSIPFAKAALLIALCLFAYFPAMRSGYIWDDDAHITKNATLHDLDGLRRMWFEPSSLPQYYPLVHTTFWVEYHLWQLNPTGYHIDNVMLHIVAALLLWRLLVILEVPGAWLAAGIFLLHPIEVESVAWITERKNVLSTVFVLAAAISYLRFEPVERNSERHWRFYFLASAFFVAALLSKTVTCTFPIVILGVLWWRGRRITLSNVLPAIPLIILGASFGLTTAWLERVHVGAQGSDWNLSAMQRALVAGRIFWFYPFKLIVPANFVFIYPRWQIDASKWWQYGFPVAAGLVLLSCWVLRERIGRGTTVAAYGYLFLLLPALGFFNVYPMRYSFVADHFQYLASIGLIALMAVGITKLSEQIAAKSREPIVIGVAALLVFACISHQRCGVFKNEESLWRDTITRNTSAWIAYNNLGELLEREKHDSQAALPLFQRCWELRPDWVSSFNLATADTNVGDYDAAIANFKRTISMAPQDPSTSALIVDLAMAMGNHLSSTGRFSEAQALYEGALRIDPERLELLNNLAWLLAVEPGGSRSDRLRSVELATTAAGLSSWKQPAILDTLAAALASAGDFEKASENEQRALQALTPESNNGLRETLEAHAHSFRDHRALHESRIVFENIELPIIDRQLSPQAQ